MCESDTCVYDSLLAIYSTCDNNHVLNLFLMNKKINQEPNRYIGLVGLCIK